MFDIVGYNSHCYIGDVMQKEKKLVSVDVYRLEKFSNEEFYYIISSLLGLGDPGFVPEKLFLSFDEQSLDNLSTVKFLLFTTTLNNDFESDGMEYHLGKLDCELNEIEIYSGRFDRLELPPGAIVDNFISFNLQERTHPRIFRPVTLLKGIERIMSQPDFEKRKGNQLFEFFEGSPVPDGIKHYYDFGKIGPLKTDFSGNYYLVVRPVSKGSNNAQICSFQVHDNYDRKTHKDFVQLRVDVKRSVVDAESIQLYDQGIAENFYRGEVNTRKENSEAHKTNMIPVLTQTVLALLNDLSPVSKENLLEDETPEELIEYCKDKYDREFDLNVDSLGIAGAHEIAWQEALAILKDNN
jgi:hypothetical protein